MRDLTVEEKWRITVECSKRFDYDSKRFKNHAMPELLEFFAHHQPHCSRRTIQTVWSDFLAKQDDDEITLQSSKKGIVGRKSGLTDDLRQHLQQQIDESAGQKSYREIAAGLQVINFSLISKV
jgi:hypothetical protein